MFALIAYASPLLAQLTQSEALTFTKKYETAYNKKDDKALKAMYTKDAIRTFNDSTVNTSSEAIRSALVMQFKANPLTITIKHDKVKIAKDGSITAIGTYHVWGKSETGEAFDIKGGYTNTIVKIKGKWKISKSEVVQK